MKKLSKLEKIVIKVKQDTYSGNDVAIMYVDGIGVSMEKVMGRYVMTRNNINYGDGFKPVPKYLKEIFDRMLSVLV